MSETSIQAILRCGLCNKPFNEQSTLKRHGYYCRSRKAGITLRTRSCISCAKGKARCDHKRPDCSRCLNKGIDCQYPQTSSKNSESQVSLNNSTVEEHQRMLSVSLECSTGTEDHEEDGNHGGIMLHDIPFTSNLDFADIGGEYLDWNGQDFDFADFLNPQATDEPMHGLPVTSSSNTRYSIPAVDQTTRVHLSNSSPDISIPVAPTFAVRAFIQRPRPEAGARRIATLLLHTMKSYSVMMRRDGSLPVFIHPHLVSSNADKDHMEPLSNCISLVHMTSSGLKGSRKLFWKNVQLECERLREEHPKLNEWELLAAMQALSIYILIRLEEGETDHNNLDFLLHNTVIVIAQQLTRYDIVCKSASSLHDSDYNVSWRAWIFEESRRRLSTIYRVLDMLVYFEPASMCELHPELILAPLPAKKQLWEASDEFAWKTEINKTSGAQKSFGLAANGELLGIGEGPMGCSHAVLRYKSSCAETESRSSNSWEEWCSGMDGFGGLVMLAASLIV